MDDYPAPTPPSIITWFKIYAVIMCVLYLAVTVASLIFFGKNTCNKLENRRETMARPVTRKPHNNCLECGADMKEVTYIRPYAKVCSDCKSLVWSVLLSAVLLSFS